MQLKKISGRLGVATCGLLQVTNSVVNAAEEWDVDAALMIYSESDGRVSAFEPGVYAGTDLADGERIDIRFIYDSLTGATPNGAHATGTAQTFTTPSGKNSYTAAAGETPLDDTFRDSRVAIGVDWTRPIDRLSKIVWGANFSTEYDYLSLGISAAYSRDFNNRNTTFTAAIGLNSDSVEPVGGTPIEFSPMRTPGAVNRTGDTSNSKTTSDILFGITQVVNRSTLMQLNLTLGQVSGYQNDPYKLLSVVDGGGTLTTAGLVNRNVDALPYVYEKRPDSRNKQSLYYKLVKHLDEDAIHFAYRYYWDDWDITSHTFDLHYRFELGDGSYLQPHVRYYMQDAAEFYRHNLVQGVDVDAAGNALIDFASNDYRLAESVTTTIGLKYGIPLGEGELDMRAEMITQSIDNAGIPAIEETPDLDSILLQVGYDFRW